MEYDNLDVVSSRKKNSPACRVPRWLVFGTSPFLGIFVLVAATIVSAALALLEPLALRGTLTILIAITMLFIVYVPFIALIVAIVTHTYQCATLPPGYLVYLLAALQLVQAHMYFVLFLFDEQGSFTNVCAINVPAAMCTHDSAFLVMARLFYYSSVTFVSVGYGDIAPISLIATLFVLPQLWSPIFFLGILLGRIVSGGGPAAAATGVQ